MNFLLFSARIIKNSLSEFEWTQLAIVYSTEERFSETFGIIKNSIDSSNHTTLYPLVPIEAYEIPQIIDILKTQSRGEIFSKTLFQPYSMSVRLYI